MTNKDINRLKKFSKAVDKLAKLVKKHNKKINALEKRIKTKRFYK